jgi:hypothetical protein
VNKKQFEALLPLIITSLLQKTVDGLKISPQKALSLIYHSALYEQLNDEATKVWYYSADKLFLLLTEELRLGHLELPEY